MRLEDRPDNKEEDTHAQCGDEKSESPSEGLYTEEDENGGGDDLDNTINTASE